MTEEEILKHEAVKPTPWHTVWDTESKIWQDSRTAEEVAAYERTRLPIITKRQFALYLDSIKATEDPEDETTLYDQVLALINQDKKKRIEYETVSDIERGSQIVAAIASAMGWSDERVDEMWRQALQIK